jgi:integrase/recombinase XerD
MSTLKVVSQTTSTPLERLVEDFLASCRARGLSPATLKRGYALHLERVFLPWCAQNGITSVEQLDQRTIDRFSSKLLGDGGDKGQLSRFSVHTYVRTVGQFLSWCRKEGEAATGKPQLPRLPRRLLDVLSRTELAAMENAAPYERDKLIIRVLADTGLRAGELCGLRAEDLMRNDRRAYLKVQGKGLQERLVPLPPALVRRIDRYQRARPVDADTDRLFIGVRRTIGGGYEGLTPSGVLQLVHGAAERAGITKRVHSHLLRHSFATEALRRGMNPIQLARILGHNSLRMIESVYSHLTPDDGYDALIAMLGRA